MESVERLISPLLLSQGIFDSLAIDGSYGSTSGSSDAFFISELLLTVKSLKSGGISLLSSYARERY